MHPSFPLLHATLAGLGPELAALPAGAHHDLVHALLRDRQPERALVHFFDMQATHRVAPAPWLLNLLAYALLAADAFPEALLLLRHRTGGSFGPQPPVPAALWAYALARAADAMHMEAVRLAWSNVADEGEDADNDDAVGTVTPSQGVCEAVLACCARHGDAALARAVLEALARRAEPGPAAWHLEALHEACLAADDVGAALDVLAHMQAHAACRPTRGTCRALFRWFDGRVATTRRAALDVLLARARPPAATATQDPPATPLPIFAVEAYVEALANVDPASALALRPAVGALCGAGARPTRPMLRGWAAAAEARNDFATLRRLRRKLGAEGGARAPAQEHDPWQHRASDVPRAQKFRRELQERRPEDWQEEVARNAREWRPWTEGGKNYEEREAARRRESGWA